MCYLYVTVHAIVGFYITLRVRENNIEGGFVFCYRFTTLFLYRITFICGETPSILLYRDRVCSRWRPVHVSCMHVCMYYCLYWYKKVSLTLFDGCEMGKIVVHQLLSNIAFCRFPCWFRGYRISVVDSDAVIETT